MGDVAHVGDVLQQHCTRLRNSVLCAGCCRPAGSVRVEELVDLFERGGRVCTLHSGVCSVLCSD